MKRSEAGFQRSRSRAPAERREAVLQAVTQVITSANSSTDVFSEILAAICGNIGWRFGALWTVDPQLNVLRCHTTWHEGEVNAEIFAAGCRSRTFAPGEGLPGRVWETAGAAWIRRLSIDQNFPRAALAATCDLQSGVGFPILIENSVVAVLEFFNNHIEEPDESLLAVLGSVGTQLGQWMDRQRKQKALEETNALMSAIINGTADVIYAKDRDGRYLLINESGARVLGRTVAQVAGRTDNELFPQDTADVIRERDLYVLEHGKPVLSEIDFDAGQGRRIHATAVSPLLIHDRITGIIGIARNITEQKRAQRSLEFIAEASSALASSLDLQATLDAMAAIAVPDAADGCVVYALSEQGSITVVAAAHEDAVKCSLIRKLEKEFPARLDDNSVIAGVVRLRESRIQNDLAADMLHNAASGAEHLRLLEQQEVGSYMAVPLIARGTVHGALLFMLNRNNLRRYDAEDLRLAQELAHRAAMAMANARLYEELKRSSRDLAMLQTITAALSKASTVHDVCETVLRHIQAATGAYAGCITEYKPESGCVEALFSIGFSQDLLDNVRRVPLDSDLPPVRAIREGKPLFISSRRELKRRRLSAHPASNSLAAATLPLSTRDGPAFGSILLSYQEEHIFSGEERTLLLAVAQQCAQALERARLYDEAAAARERAERASRAKDAFLAMLSHELRTPLTAIKGWTMLMRDKKLDEERLSAAFESLERNVGVLAELVNDLLDISRITSGKLHLNHSTVSPESSLKAAIEAVRSTAQIKSIQIHFDTGTVPEIIADGVRLEQIFWNVLTNAVKFTPRGGQIDVRLRSTSRDICVTITDNGVGISREYLPHVFERFSQAESSTSRTTGGLGLGLSIVRHLVELHGGTVRIHSDGLNCGTTCEILLPIPAVENRGQSR